MSLARLAMPAALVAAGLAASPRIFSDGPPAARTGGFGEKLCSECHYENPINDSTGALEVSGLPERWEAAREYDLTIGLRHPELERGGFQLAIRWLSGPRSARQAGRLIAVDSGVVLRDSLGIVYAQHANSREPADRAAVIFRVRWDSPEAANDTIAVDVAGNAGNGDFSPLGDHVYTRRLILIPDR